MIASRNTKVGETYIVESLADSLQHVRITLDDIARKSKCPFEKHYLQKVSHSDKEDFFGSVFVKSIFILILLYVLAEEVILLKGWPGTRRNCYLLFDISFVID